MFERVHITYINTHILKNNAELVRECAETAEEN